MSDGGKAVALVFCAQHPTGLMTARSLRGIDLEIIGFAYSDSPCLRSSVWDSLQMIERSPESLIQAVFSTAASRSGIMLLFPADDESVKILSDRRHELPNNCILPLPDTAIVDLMLDKSKFYPWADSQGFPVPATIKVTSFSELDRAIKEIGYPLIIKPMYRTCLWDCEFPNDKIFILDTSEHLDRLPEKLFQVVPDILVQQWIPGTDAEVYFCLVCYDQHGKLIDQFCGRKLMQWPPMGGSTAVAISDEFEESLKLTLNIFDVVGYQGLGSMEYKKDIRTGKLYIMEPTVGRNDFQSYLAVTGGVNLTHAVYNDLLGRPQDFVGKRRPSAWVCEPSFYYGLRHYLRKRDGYFLRHLWSLFRRTGFAYLDLLDLSPFFSFVKSRIG